MKPYIIDAHKDGRFSLPFQFEGIKRENLYNIVRHESIVAYSVPAGQTIESAWLLRMYFSSQVLLEFSSAATMVGGWNEVGSLNICLVPGINSNASNGIFELHSIECFKLEMLEILSFVDDNIYAECGLVFSDLTGGKIIVAAGVSPGSVSLSTPFANGELRSQFPLNDYRIRPI